MCLISLSSRHMCTAQGYKAHVGGVSLRHGIEQICEALVKADNSC